MNRQYFFLYQAQRRAATDYRAFDTFIRGRHISLMTKSADCMPGRASRFLTSGLRDYHAHAALTLLLTTTLHAFQHCRLAGSISPRALPIYAWRNFSCYQVRYTLALTHFRRTH